MLALVLLPLASPGVGRRKGLGEIPALIWQPGYTVRACQKEMLRITPLTHDDA
jgi:hypothetical protein